MDKESGNSFWKDVTKKEMKNIEVAFKFLDDGTKMPFGFKKITCHLIFDVKFDFTRKARYLGGGHLTQVSPSLSYSSVVLRDSVRIMFLVAALNDLDVKMCDIGNAFLNCCKPQAFSCFSIQVCISDVTHFNIYIVQFSDEEHNTY